MTAILAYILQAIVLLQPAGPGETTRAIVADGSVWADVGHDEPGGRVLRSTERLCDHDPSARWIATDVDGDGRQDLVAVRVDSLGIHLDVWHNGLVGFTRMAAAPGHLVLYGTRALCDAIAALIGLDTPVV